MMNDMNNGHRGIIPVMSAIVKGWHTHKERCSVHALEKGPALICNGGIRRDATKGEGRAWMVENLMAY